MGQWTKKFTDSQSNAIPGCWKFWSAENLREKQRLAFWVDFLPPLHQYRIWKNSSFNPNTVKSTEFWFSVRKKWCLEKRIADEIEKYKPAELNTLLERFYAAINAFVACGGWVPQEHGELELLTPNPNSQNTEEPALLATEQRAPPARKTLPPPQSHWTVQNLLSKWWLRLCK